MDHRVVPGCLGLFRDEEVRAVVHDGGEIVRRTDVFPFGDGDLVVVGSGFGDDVLEVDFDVLVAVAAGLLVVEAERVEELVLDGPHAQAVWTKVKVLPVPKDVSNVRPAAFLNVSTVKLNKSTNGSGPEDLPPKVLSLAPAARTLDTSHAGT